MNLENDITVCITSHNRPELLESTIGSFIRITAPIKYQINVLDDSKNKSFLLQCCTDLHEIHHVQINQNENPLGQVASVDKLYKEVKTPYIFHCEDDYLFDGNPNFMRDSYQILEENPDIHQVWIRHEKDYKVSHGLQYIELFEDRIRKTSTGVEFKMVNPDHHGWCGFSFNPGLRRVADYKKMFPNGYQEFEDPRGLDSELFCNNHAASLGYRAALLNNGVCFNIGHNRSSYKWKRRFKKWFG